MDGTAFDFSRTNPQSVFTDSIESSSCKNTDADQSTVRRVHRVMNVVDNFIPLPSSN